MNKTPEMNPNEEMEAWEMRVQQEAKNFPYPPTPDIVPGVRLKLRRSPRPVSFRLAQVAALIVVIFGVLLAYPPTRAIMVEIIRIGAVRLLPYPPSPTPTPAFTETPLPAGAATRPPRPLPTLLPTPLLSILDLPGEITLEEAQKLASFPVRLPTYPENAGVPDHVFFQAAPVPVVTMVWLESPESDTVWFALAFIGEAGFFGKFYPWDEQNVSVNGRAAIWLTEPHELYEELPVQDRVVPVRRMVNDFVLVWVDGSETYRLETDLPLEEALKIAESLE